MPEPDPATAASRRRWTEDDQEKTNVLWAWILVPLIKVYDGPRKTMWERIPNAMVSAARQNTRLAGWLTTCLRSLQIPAPGRPTNADSISAGYDMLRTETRKLPPDPASAERRALRQLTEETAAIVAEAMVQWDAIKGSRRKQK